MENKINSGNKICPQCQNEIGFYDKVCCHCGQKFEVEYEDARAAYIQDRVGTYLNKFDRIDSGEKASSWNWCAFLFTCDWLIYRKMYKLAVIVMVALVAVDIIAEIACFAVISNELVAGLVAKLIPLVAYVYIGIMGDRWYKKKIDKLVEEGAVLEPNEKIEHYKKGGTNVVAVIVILIISNGLSLLLM